MKNKRQFFWGIYKKDPTLAQFKGTQKHTIENKQENSMESGWMNKYKVAEMNGIFPGVPDYEALCDDLVSDLQSMPHENPKLAARGFKMYYYFHQHNQKIILNQTKGMDLEQEVALTEQQYNKAVKDLQKDTAMASGDPSSSTNGPFGDPAVSLQAAPQSG